jgi:hypothetical protein
VACGVWLLIPPHLADHHGEAAKGDLPGSAQLPGSYHGALQSCECSTTYTACSDSCCQGGISCPEGTLACVGQLNPGCGFSGLWEVTVV